MDNGNCPTRLKSDCELEINNRLDFKDISNVSIIIILLVISGKEFLTQKSCH